ncbi:MAG TPA: terpene synthase family protein [Thermomicrobiales bacterium]|nr:terpene synthase family protein [Thermomicrobiales bacterium]
MAQATLAPASPWSGLRSQFLDSRDPADQVHIFDLSARAAQVLHRWAARYPLIRRVRVWPLALSVAAAAPYSSVDALISTARLSLWVFTLDDLFDEERVPSAELMRRAERYRAIARGRPTPLARDSLATALAEVRDDLARYPLFAALEEEWAEALCGTIDGMTREYEWRLSYRHDHRAPLPTYEEYLVPGRYSIGGPPHVWAALIATDDPSTPRHLDHLRPMEELASTCIRLANDLQSYAKELGESKINALVLLTRAYRRLGLPEAEAARQAELRVRADIANGLAALTTLQEDARTRTRRPEAAIADIARFVCDFYRKHDYHTFVMGRTAETGG